MREILFRGKDIIEIWHIGLLAHIGNSWYISNKAGIATAFEVIPETVGQYTGLKDKNGKKIFEGDIVAGALRWLEKSKNGIVTFKNGSFGLLWHRGEAEQFNPFTSMCNIEYEVIGNIHDNKLEDF